MKVGLAVFALQLGIIANAHAGGASVLQLPIEGVTKENSDQCAKLFEKVFSSVLINWKNGNVKMIKEGSTNLVQLRPERGQISLSEIERALKGSPFSIKREQLVYVSLLRLHIGKVEDHEKHVDALANLDGKKLTTHFVVNADGSLWITLRDPTRNAAISVREKREKTLMTHRRLTRYLSENKIDLIAISWGRHRTEQAEAWRGDFFGARLTGEVSIEGKHARMVIPEVIDRISDSSDKLLNRSELTRRLTRLLQTPDAQILIRFKVAGDASSEGWYSMGLKTKEVVVAEAPRNKKAFITLAFPHFGNEFTAVSEGLQMTFRAAPNVKLLRVSKLDSKDGQGDERKPVIRPESK